MSACTIGVKQHQHGVKKKPVKRMLYNEQGRKEQLEYLAGGWSAMWVEIPWEGVLEYLANTALDGPKCDCLQRT